MTTSNTQPEQIDRRRLFLSLGGMLLFFVLGLFLPAGTWMWTRGWLFILVIVVASILSTFTCDESIPMSSLLGSTATRGRNAGICSWG